MMILKACGAPRYRQVVRERIVRHDAKQRSEASTMTVLYISATWGKEQTHTYPYWRNLPMVLPDLNKNMMQVISVGLYGYVFC
jgi:hypothetical protein